MARVVKAAPLKALGRGVDKKQDSQYTTCKFDLHYISPPKEHETRHLRSRHDYDGYGTGSFRHRIANRKQRKPRSRRATATAQHRVFQLGVPIELASRILIKQPRLAQQITPVQPLKMRANRAEQYKPTRVYTLNIFSPQYFMMWLVPTNKHCPLTTIQKRRKPPAVSQLGNQHTDEIGGVSKYTRPCIVLNSLTAMVQKSYATGEGGCRKNQQVLL